MGQSVRFFRKWNYYEHNSPSFQHKRSDSVTQPTWQPSNNFYLWPAEFCQLKWRFQGVIYMHHQITSMQGKRIYLHCPFFFFFGQTGKISRKQNNCEWRVFPEPSLTFGRQKGKEQHWYFLHIMLLSGSHRVKKEICAYWHLAQKYSSEVLSLFY